MAGLTEDFTKNISPRRRLFFTAVSAALAVWGLQSVIDHTAIPGLDWVVSFPLGAALVTIFVVVGVANSLNIIDGFNGLASMCGMLILAALAYVGFQVDDMLTAWLALAGVGTLLGFFIWNYPAGLVFLGDGGAYFLGFYVAEMAILQLHRNPQVSPMFPLLACIYPGVRDRVLDLPAPRAARPVARVSRRHSPAFADLSPRRALGGRQPRSQGADAAQLDDLALPVAAVHVRRGARRCCSGTTRRCWPRSSCCSA